MRSVECVAQYVHVPAFYGSERGILRQLWNANKLFWSWKRDLNNVVCFDLTVDHSGGQVGKWEHIVPSFPNTWPVTHRPRVHNTKHPQRDTKRPWMRKKDHIKMKEATKRCEVTTGTQTDAQRNKMMLSNHTETQRGLDKLSFCMSFSPVATLLSMGLESLYHLFFYS